MFDINCPMNTINTATFVNASHTTFEYFPFFSFCHFPRISLSVSSSQPYSFSNIDIFFSFVILTLWLRDRKMQRMIGVHLIFPLPNSPSIVSLFILSFLALFSHNLTFVFNKVISCFLSSRCLSYLATVRVKLLISMDQKHL